MDKLTREEGDTMGDLNGDLLPSEVSRVGKHLERIKYLTDFYKKLSQMKVMYTYIVKVEGKLQTMYHTETANHEDGWFVTGNGAFGQRETSLQQISYDRAKEILGYDPYKGC